MFVDRAASPLNCENNDNYDEESQSTVNMAMLPIQDDFIENEYTYDQQITTSPKDNSKFLYVLFSIFIIFIGVIALTLWIFYYTYAKTPEYHMKYTTTQPLHVETSLDTFPEISTKISSTTTTPSSTTTTMTSLSTTSAYKSTTGVHSTTEIGIQQLEKKVLFIVADGIPADVIEKVSTINLKYIQNLGGYTRAYVGGDKGTYSQTATISSPGYMSLLTGTWGNKHNIYNNYVKNPNYHYKNIFRLVKEQQPKKKIGIFSTWITNRVKLIGEGLPEAGNITFDYKFDGYELDRITYPHDKQSLYIHNIDQRVTNETSECIRMYAPDLSWVYLQYTDDIGHYFGDSDRFNQSIIYLDNQIGRIWEAIDYRMKYYNEDWLMIITTDHGRDPIKGKHHAGQSSRERTTWIITNNKEMNTYFYDYQPGIIDILPTIARFMNLTIPIGNERELDGIPLIGKVSLIKPNVNLNNDKLNITWTVLDNTGNVTIWLSTTNLFKKGQIDDYKLMDIVSIDKKMVLIDIKQYPSQFYKIVLEGQYNTVNRWIYRPRRQDTMKI